MEMYCAGNVNLASAFKLSRVICAALPFHVDYHKICLVFVIQSNNGYDCLTGPQTDRSLTHAGYNE
jgi:hypothetical protein